MTIEKRTMIGNALEGESYVGKTTVLEGIRNLEEVRARRIIIVPEYSVIGELPDFPRDTIEDVKTAIQKMIDLEKKRTDRLVKDLAVNKDALVIFDRGPITCIAFENAAQRAGFRGATLWMAEAFQREIEDKSILIPNGMIYLKAARKTIKTRELERVKKGGVKVIEFLRNRDVAKSLNEVFEQFGQSLPPQLFLMLETDKKSPNEICAEVLQFIKGQKDDVLNHITDFLSFARSLTQGK